MYILLILPNPLIYCSEDNHKTVRIKYIVMKETLFNLRRPVNISDGPKLGLQEGFCINPATDLWHGTLFPSKSKCLLILRMARVGCIPGLSAFQRRHSPSTAPLE